jgi:hypothetical protein
MAVLLISGFQMVFMGFISQTIAKPCASFRTLVGKTDWQVSIRDVTVGLKKNDITFELRMGDEHHFDFNAYRGNDRYRNRLGPLQEKNLPQLFELLTVGLSFLGQDRMTASSLALHWFSYPESIKNWALIWKKSDLKANWDQTDPYQRHDRLVKMISHTVKTDFQPIVHPLGFNITGASMEKMGFQKAGTLEFYDIVLKPAEIPAELKIPIPFILSLSLTPSNDISQRDIAVEGSDSCSLESFFSIARQGKKTIYCSFQRPFDRYEISGDHQLPDGRLTPLRPLSEKAYQGIAAKLLRAGLISTQRDSKNPVSLKLNVRDYPGIYQEMATYFSDKSRPGLTTGIQRAELPNHPFFLFHPSPGTGFQESIAPFLALTGLKLKEFQISLNNKKPAEQYDTYDTLLKPLGFKPEDRPNVPDLVYMMVEKNKNTP